MNNLTTIVTAPRGFRFTPSHIDYAFVKRIVLGNPRQLSYELMANGDVMKNTESGNFLFGLKAGDSFVIDGTKRDLVEINKRIKNHKRYVYFDVITKIIGEQLVGKCQ